MRYEVRWSNGFWKTFDSHCFTDVEKHSLRVDAERAVDALNSGIKSDLPLAK